VLSLRIDPALLAAAVLAFTVLPASAQYKVRTGDILELDVSGIAGMRTRMPIDSAGTIRVPLIGPVKVAGMPLDEINNIVRQRLTAKTLPQLNPNSGQVQQIFFDAAQIAVNVAEYRPVYVSGDVATPGQHAFRPGLTVRQVISLAGGYQSLKSRAADAMVTSSFDWQAELNSELITLARERIRLQRVRSQLAGDTKPPKFVLGNPGVGPDVVNEFMKSEIETFELDAATRNKELTFLRNAVENAKQRVAILKEQQEREKEGLDADTADYKRLLALADSGATTTSRLTDSRRNILFSSTRYLQTTTQIGQLERELETLRRDREKLEETRRVALSQELWRVLSAIAASKVRIKFLTEKLTYAGGMRSIASDNDTVTIHVARQSENGVTKFVAGKDVALEPGDVVEVVMKAFDFGEHPDVPEDKSPSGWE